MVRRVSDAQKLVEIAQGGGIATTVLVLVGLMILLKLVDSVVDIVRKWRKRGNVDEQRIVCNERFASDQRRLDSLEEAQKHLVKGQKILMRGVAEMIGHDLHNGNREAMEESEKELKDFIFS